MLDLWEADIDFPLREKLDRYSFFEIGQEFDK